MRTIRPSKALPALPRAARAAGDDYGVPARPGWREVDWSRHIREATIDGRRVNYVDIGAGPGAPVLFVHGLGGNWQNWLENLPRVARERRAVAVDLPGFGRSQMAPGAVSISGYARFLDAFCDELGLGHVAVVGNSMGGFISAELAITFPARVERLVLAAAAGISSTNLRRRPLLTSARLAGVVVAMATARTREAVSRPRLRHLVFGLVIRHPTRMRPDLLFELLRGAGKRAFLPALDALMDYDFRDRLPEIACPTLLVWGAEDMLVPVEDADEFERLIPDARKVILEDTGHVPMLERPEAFNAGLMEFLAETGEAGDRQSAAA